MIKESKLFLPGGNYSHLIEQHLDNLITFSGCQGQMGCDGSTGQRSQFVNIENEFLTSQPTVFDLTSGEFIFKLLGQGILCKYWKKLNIAE